MIRCCLQPKGRNSPQTLKAIVHQFVYYCNHWISVAKWIRSLTTGSKTTFYKPKHWFINIWAFIKLEVIHLFCEYIIWVPLLEQTANQKIDKVKKFFLSLTALLKQLGRSKKTKKVMHVLCLCKFYLSICKESDIYCETNGFMAM